MGMQEQKGSDGGAAAGTRIPCMQGGSGDDSYARSSSPQNFIFRTYTCLHLSKALDHLCTSPHILQSLHLGALAQDAPPACTVAGLLPLSQTSPPPPPPSLTVADLGCSHGRNTLDYAAFILQGLHDRLCINVSSMPLEIQYLFSDLPANNFNSLFQSLQGFLQGIGSHTSPSCRIFTGAVAGSFHGPLFPTCSLHFAMSAYSLHWLSQVPPEVLDRASPAWNGGYVWLDGQRSKVMQAFASQHQKDMKVFFKDRARELVKGGILFLLLPCRPELDPQGPLYSHRTGLFSGFLESTWAELVSEGLISEEERDMFNLPLYFCHESELRTLLDQEFAGVFQIVKMETMSRNSFAMPKDDEQNLLDDPQVYGKFWANFIASLVRPMMEAHLGEERGTIFFKRLEALITKRAREATHRTHDHMVAIIQRL